jgi:LacI family transcriptional regulator
MTIIELAGLVGTSPASVSLVLNGKWEKKVRPDIASKVQNLAQKHNFSLNIAGRSLVMQKHFRVIVCAESSLIEHELMGAYSFHEQLGIISAELSKSQYSIDIVRLDEYDGKTAELNLRLESNCDGVIFLSPKINKIKAILKKLSLNVPYIVVDSNLKNKLQSYIFTDMVLSVRDIIDRLIGEGHERIAIVRGESSDERFEQKLLGYKKALLSDGIEYLPELVFDDYQKDAFLKGSIAAEKLFNMKKPPTAVLCTDNCCGLGFVQYANKQGFSIPGDIKIVGFGDAAISMFSSPRLTYLKRPVREMARKAVEILLELIDKKDVREPMQYEFKEELVIQETAFLNRN